MSNGTPWNDRRFIFVGGLHRSGTTFLAKLIGASSQASGLENTGVRMDEGQFLQDVFLTGAQMGGVARWAYDPRSHLTEVEAKNLPDAGQRLWDGWNRYWRHDADFLLEKTPLNLTRTRFLQAVFPHSRFVVITRHPLTQALAIRKWTPRMNQELGGFIPRLVDHWLKAHEVFRNDENHLRHVHVVRYEHLLADPRAEIARLEAFLGISIPRETAGDLDRTYAESYEKLWNGGVKGPRAPGQNIVDRLVFPRYERTIKRLYTHRIRELGYELDSFTQVEPWVSLMDPTI